eukprot:scaffold163508_cov27-Tisochrysis_lutea.AAC.6
MKDPSSAATAVALESMAAAGIGGAKTGPTGGLICGLSLERHKGAEHALAFGAPIHDESPAPDRCTPPQPVTGLWERHGLVPRTERVVSHLHSPHPSDVRVPTQTPSTISWPT